jgi:hypothetical protein
MAELAWIGSRRKQLARRRQIFDGDEHVPPPPKTLLSDVWFAVAALDPGLPQQPAGKVGFGFAGDCCDDYELCHTEGVAG